MLPFICLAMVMLAKTLFNGFLKLFQDIQNRAITKVSHNKFQSARPSLQVFIILFGGLLSPINIVELEGTTMNLKIDLS